MNDQKTEYQEVYNLAAKCMARYKLEDAMSHVQKALEIAPESVEVHNLWGSILVRQGDIEQAETVFTQALNLAPENAYSHNNLGLIALSMGNYKAALARFDQALELMPELMKAMFNKANMHAALGDYENAEQAYRIYLESRPKVERALINMAKVLELKGDYQQAIEHYSRVISGRPDHAAAHFSRGMLNMKLGRFEPGWRDMNWRFQSQNIYYGAGIDWDHPEWDGSDLQGKTILVHHEQGLGDAIHFVRYLPFLKEMGAYVIFRCGPPLLRLLESVPEIDELHNRLLEFSHQTIHYDCQVSLMSLPGIFDTRMDSIPCPSPYLFVPEESILKWKGAVDKNYFNIGLVWSGKLSQGENHFRSCTLKDYAPLAKIEGVKLYSLQKGPAGQQVDENSGSMEVLDYSQAFNDLTETGALIKNLDLVVTVDTSIAHLTGALGCPVWTLLWKNHCWRYLTQRTDSPWYPSMRLFRQEIIGDWVTPIERVVEEVKSLMQKNVAPN